MQTDVETGTFAGSTTARLLERLAFKINAAIHSHDEKAVHDVRVAIRRFAQGLTLFKKVFAAKDLKKVRRRLKRLMDATSDARDCDVAVLLLEKSGEPGAEQFFSQLREQRREAIRLLLPELKGWSARRTTAKWRTALTPNGDGHVPLAETVRERLPRMAKKFLKEGDRASSAHELHHARIEAKKLRYAIELVQPGFADALTPALQSAKRAQSLLGAANDCHATRQRLEKLGGEPGIDAWLKKRQHQKIREFRKEWDTIAATMRDSMKALKHPERKPAIRAVTETELRVRTA